MEFKAGENNVKTGDRHKDVEALGGGKTKRERSAGPLPEFFRTAARSVSAVLVLDSPEEEQQKRDVADRRVLFGMKLVMMSLGVIFLVFSLVFLFSMLLTATKMESLSREYDVGKYREYSREYKIPEVDVLSYMKYADIAARLYHIDRGLLVAIFRTSRFDVNFRDTSAGLFGLCMINPVIMGTTTAESRDERGIFIAARYLAENIKRRGFNDSIYVYFNYDKNYIAKFLSNYGMVEKK